MTKEFNTIVLKQLREDLTSSLSSIEKKFGIKLSIGTIRFDSQRFSAKFSGMIVEKGSENVNIKELQYKHALEQLGEWFFPKIKLSVDDYGKEFTDVNGKEYTFIGIAAKRRKFPVACKDKSGKVVLFTESILHRIKS